MIELIELGAELQRLLEERKWAFCFIGGIALIRWGEPRFTRDLDVTLLTGFGGEDEYIDILLQQFKSRHATGRDFALRNRVLLLESRQGFPIDIALGALPFEERMVKRSSLFEFADGISLRTCSAEDLIVTKAFADRNRDWADIESILPRQANKLDWSYIKDQLAPLCELKESPHIISRLDVLRNK